MFLAIPLQVRKKPISNSSRVHTCGSTRKAVHVYDSGFVGVEELAMASGEGKVIGALVFLGAAEEEGGGGGGGREGGGAGKRGRRGYPFLAAVVEAKEVEAHINGGVIPIVDVDSRGSEEVFG